MSVGVSNVQQDGNEVPGIRSATLGKEGKAGYGNANGTNGYAWRGRELSRGQC